MRSGPCQAGKSWLTRKSAVPESLSWLIRKTAYGRKYARVFDEAKKSGMLTILVYAAAIYGYLLYGIHADLRTHEGLMSVRTVAAAFGLMLAVSTVRPLFSPATDDLHSLIYRLPFDHKKELAAAIALQQLPTLTVTLLVILYLLPLNGLGAAYLPVLVSVVVAVILHSLALSGTQRVATTGKAGVMMASASLLGCAVYFGQPWLIFTCSAALIIWSTHSIQQTHRGQLEPGFISTSEVNFINGKARRLGLDSSAGSTYRHSSVRLGRLPYAHHQRTSNRHYWIRTTNHLLNVWPATLAAMFTVVAYVISFGWTSVPPALGPLVLILINLVIARAIGPELSKALPVNTLQQQLYRVLPGALLTCLLATLGAVLGMLTPLATAPGSSDHLLLVTVTALTPLMFLFHAEWLQRMPVVDPETRSRLRTSLAMLPAIIVYLLNFFGLAALSPFVLVIAAGFPILDSYRKWKYE